MNTLDQNSAVVHFLQCDCLCCRVQLSTLAAGLHGPAAVVAAMVGLANVRAVATFDVVQIASEMDPSACKYVLGRLVDDGFVTLTQDTYHLRFPPVLPCPSTIQ